MLTCFFSFFLVWAAMAVFQYVDAGVPTSAIQVQREIGRNDHIYHTGQSSLYNHKFLSSFIFSSQNFIYKVLKENTI